MPALYFLASLQAGKLISLNYLVQLCIGQARPYASASYDLSLSLGWSGQWQARDSLGLIGSWYELRSHTIRAKLSSGEVTLFGCLCARSLWLSTEIVWLVASVLPPIAIKALVELKSEQ